MLNPTLVTKISADYAGLIALFTRKLGDRALAEDIVNDAFVESLHKLAQKQIADASRFSGYVYGVAFNLLRNHQRLMDNRLDVRADPSVLERIACDRSPFQQLFRDRTAQWLRRLIDSLPLSRDREIIRRFYLEEQDKHIICRDLGLSPLNFDRVVFRARRRMRILMEVQGMRQEDCCWCGDGWAMG